MDFKENLNKLMSEAQKMQEKMLEAQKELVKFETTGEAGGGLVKVVMNGRHDVQKVTMNSNLMDEDKEMIEDLMAAAFNDAVRKIEKISKDKISDLTSGMQLPENFQFPKDEEDKD